MVDSDSAIVLDTQQQQQQLFTFPPNVHLPFDFLAYATLSEQCMQVLHVASLLVYAFNSATDWLLTYCVGKELSITFKPRDWLPLIMIGCSTIGSICTFCLTYLCVEQALGRRRVDIEPYRVGCSFVSSRFMNWIWKFDCFRLSFLILIFEDAPMTFINFWLLNACSIPNGGQLIWPQLLKSIGALCSLAWRAIMTYYAYKNLWLLRMPLGPLGECSINSPTPDVRQEYLAMEEVKESLRAGRSDLRISEYDVGWPMRVGHWIAFPERISSYSTQTRRQSAPGRSRVAHVVRACCCLTLSSSLYFLMCVACCFPCCYFYCCQKSTAARAKCARLCVRWSSLVFYVLLLLLSTMLLCGLLVLNGIWISSAYVVGSNHIPPGMRYVCAYINEHELQVYVLYEPHYPFQSSAAAAGSAASFALKGYCFDIERAFQQRNAISIRKPLVNGTGSFFFTVQKHDPYYGPPISYHYGFHLSGRLCQYSNRTFDFPFQQSLGWPYWLGCRSSEPQYLLDSTSDSSVCNVSLV